jgi:signal transduction histidine kinase
MRKKEDILSVVTNNSNYIVKKESFLKRNGTNICFCIIILCTYACITKNNKNPIFSDTIEYGYLNKQTINLNYLIMISVMGLITIGILYYLFRIKRKRFLRSTIIKHHKEKEELKKSNDSKRCILGIIAHDLVAPFNAILGYTSLLENDYDRLNEKERKQFICIINKYAKSNYNFTRTLLDWAKVRQDQLVVFKETLSCKEIIKTAIHPYRILADKKNIRINTNFSENVIIKADKNMMQSVIGNLFVNAVKFTPKNGEINLYLHKNKVGLVEIKIEDNGIGMTEKQLDNLFDITKTKTNTRQGTSNEKGNGLGLISSKELMELQKGTLKIFSKKNIGTIAVLNI